MKKFLLAAALAMMPFTAVHAASLTFYFDMPAFNITEQSTPLPGAPAFQESFSGKTSVFAVTVENGGQDQFNQNFAMGDITAGKLISVDGTSVTGGVFLAGSFLNDVSQTLITTDATGLATMNVMGSQRGAVVFFDPNGNGRSVYQLSFTGPSGYGACTYSVALRDTDGNGNHGGICEGQNSSFPETFTAMGTLGNLISAPVPVPASLPLLAGGVMLLGFWGKRPQKRTR